MKTIIYLVLGIGGWLVSGQVYAGFVIAGPIEFTGDGVHAPTLQDSSGAVYTGVSSGSGPSTNTYWGVPDASTSGYQTLVTGTSGGTVSSIMSGGSTLSSHAYFGGGATLAMSTQVELIGENATIDISYHDDRFRFANPVNLEAINLTYTFAEPLSISSAAGDGHPRRNWVSGISMQANSSSVGHTMDAAITGIKYLASIQDGVPVLADGFIPGAPLDLLPLPNNSANYVETSLSGGRFLADGSSWSGFSAFDSDETGTVPRPNYTNDPNEGNYYYFTGMTWTIRPPDDGDPNTVELFDSKAIFTTSMNGSQGVFDTEFDWENPFLSIPEPSSILLLVIACFPLLWRRRKAEYFLYCPTKA